jgi:hypothetical protein
VPPLFRPKAGLRATTYFFFSSTSCPTLAPTAAPSGLLVSTAPATPPTTAPVYPPQYRQSTEAAVESVTVTLLNLLRPSAWDEVSDWLDRHGSIAKADIVRIAKGDTLKGSKLLGAWREQGLLPRCSGAGSATWPTPTRHRAPTPRFCYLRSKKTTRRWAIKSFKSSTSRSVVCRGCCSHVAEAAA